MNLAEQKLIVDKLALLAASGFEDWGSLGNIYARYERGRVLLNYTGVAGRKSPWNACEQVCRGLILSTGHVNVAAWPFEKFFNIGEGGRKPVGHMVMATEKVDGSLGILYRDIDNRLKIVTRGAFDSDHAIWATEFMHKWHSSVAHEGLAHAVTYMFEIITPEFRNVIDYGDRPRLVLLAARNRRTGEYLPYYPDLYMTAKTCGFDIVNHVPFHNIGEVLVEAGKIDGTQEGWVIQMSNGERWKVKGDEYVELHRLLNSITLKKALGSVLDESPWLDTGFLPEEHEDRWNFYVDCLTEALFSLIAQAKGLMIESPNGDRKRFAKWALSGERQELSQLLFALLDEKPDEEIERMAKRIMERRLGDGKYDWIEESYTK